MPGPVKVVADPGLEERLRAVPGVAGAEVGGAGRIRIRMLPGADPLRVMEAVRGILGEEGLRVRAAPPRGKVEPVEPPPPPPTPGAFRPASETPAPPRGAALSSVVVEEEREDRIRVSVGSSDGRRVERGARPGRRGLEEALLQAVAALVLPDGPAPGLHTVEERTVGELTVVTVVLEGPSGRELAGSAIVRSGWPFAFARAVWAALTG